MRRRERGIPFSTSVFDENGHHTFNRAIDGTVDDDRLHLLTLLVRVLKLEVLWKLEVQLDGGTLVRSLQSIRDMYVCSRLVNRF